MQEIIVLVITLITLTLFVVGKLRYDFIALLMLLSLVIFNIIKPAEAFLGFSNPAIITITSVLVISSALVKTNAIDALVNLVNKGSNNITIKLIILMSITALLSGFMNNVGALAIMLPIVLKISKDNNINSSKLLMPVAFSSLLGGMITTIGTPSNLIVSNYRYLVTGEHFKFFEFSILAVIVIIVGVLFTSLIGYKLIPSRIKSESKSFNIEDYLFEVLVDSSISNKGLLLKDFFNTYNVSINVISIFRNNRTINSIGANNKIYPGDILIVKAITSNLNDLINKTCLSLVGAKSEKLVSKTLLKSDDIILTEVILRDDSHLIGKTAVETKLRNRYNANLIAVSRKGNYQVDRLKTLKFNSGDILLLQAPRDNLVEMYHKMSVIPINESSSNISLDNNNKNKIITLLLFSLGIIITVLNILPVYISFLMVATFLVVFKVLSPREFYQAIEWPSIIMIASLFSLGLAMESSGLSNLIAEFIINVSSSISPNYIVLIIMIITIILTNIINNTAATILVAPIAVSISINLGINLDTLLVSIIVGAAMSFLTPIAHQSNMLVMAPGSYKFSDYYKLGLPLVILSVLISFPLILLMWPL